MRLVIAAAIAVFAAAGTMAQPVSTAPLAAQELLLELDVVGTSRSLADRSMTLVQISASGATAAEARAASEALRQRIVAAAQSAGVASEAVRPFLPGGRIGFVGNESFDLAARLAEVRHERSMLEITLRDGIDFDRLRSALEAAGAESVSDPVHVLSDELSAKRSARADGLARAQAEAEAYANALGMRVARIVRVSERAADGFASIEYMEAMMRRVGGVQGNPQPEIEIEVRVAVDFALAPQ